MNVFVFEFEESFDLACLPLSLSLKRVSILRVCHKIWKLGTCTCNQVYIGETARNLEVRVNEHSDINKQSEPAKHLKKHPEHKFTWDILTSAHSRTKRKIKEAFYIARFNPVLNKQVQSFHLTLYPMGTGIT